MDPLRWQEKTSERYLLIHHPTQKNKTMRLSCCALISNIVASTLSWVGAGKIALLDAAQTNACREGGGGGGGAIHLIGSGVKG